MSPFCFLSFNFFHFCYSSGADTILLFSLSFLSSFWLTLCTIFKFILVNLVIRSSFVQSIVDIDKETYKKKKMFDVSTLFLFLYINTSWRELRLARKFVMILLSSSIGQHTYNVSFLFFLPVYTHKYKTMKYLFCFVIYNVNGIFFSLMFCHFYDAFFFCQLIAFVCFSLFYLSFSMHGVWKAYILSTYNASLRIIIFL